MKNYVRNNNTSFRLGLVEILSLEWRGTLDPKTAPRHFHEVKKHEKTFRKEDDRAPELESE